MDTCAHCGQPIASGSTACPSCGAPVAAPVSPASTGGAPHPAAGSVTALQPWEIVLMAAGALALIASFLPFNKFDLGLLGSTSWSAWSTEFNLFPAVTLAALAIVAVGVVVALRRFAPAITLPDGVDRNADSIGTIAVVLSTLTIAAFVVRSFDVGVVDRGVGAWLLLIAAIAAVVGVVMRGTASRPEPAPVAPAVHGTLQPFAIVVIAAAALTLLGSFLDVLGGGTTSVNAWDGNGTFPVYTLPALLATVAAVVVVLVQLGRLGGGVRLLGVGAETWAQAAGIGAAVLMVSYLIGDPAGGSGSVDRKIGFWLMLLGTVAVAVAMVMGPRLQFPMGASPSSPPSPPSPPAHD